MGQQLMRIAVGAERALSDSKSAVNIWMSDEEIETVLSVKRRMDAATSGKDNPYHPTIHLIPIGG